MLRLINVVRLFLNSLPNVSNGIRWSLDLRWQNDGAPGCLWGMKDGVTMRRACDPNYQMDWTHTDSVNRNTVQTVYMKGGELVSEQKQKLYFLHTE